MDIEVKNRIEEILKNPVVLFMKGTPDFPQCGFSGQAIQLLEASHASYAYFNIFEDPELREALKEYSNWPTYPQLYINGELVGGCDIIIDMYNKGDLQKALASVDAVAES